MPGDRLARQLRTIFSRLLAGFDGALDPDTCQQIGERYDRLLTELQAAETTVEKSTALRSFLDALCALPEARRLVGPDLTRAAKRVRRDGLSDEAAALLDTLPPTLQPAQMAMAEPPLARDDEPAGVVADTRSGDAAAAVDGAADAGAADAGATDAGAAGPAERPPLTRFPDVEYPAHVVVGQRTSLGVFLLRTPPAPATPGIRIADRGDAPPKIEIVIWARGFDVEGSNTALVEVARDDDTFARFVLIPRQAGEQAIGVDFYQEGRRIGTVKRRTTVVEPALAGPAPVSTLRDAEAVDPLEIVPVGGRVSVPDLELCVQLGPEDVEPGARRVLHFRLHATNDAIGYHHAAMGSVTLAGPPRDKLQSVYAEVTRLAPAPTRPLTSDEVDGRRRRLESLGRQLWDDLFPDPLKQAYWDFKDRVHTLLLTSEEPWIPWEMVRPYRFDADGIRQDEPFLCERFALARWLSPTCPADRLAVDRVRPVAPTASNLAALADEIRFIEELGRLRAGIVADPPYDDCRRVIDLFEAGRFSVLHIAAHANFDAMNPDASPIRLTDGTLEPSDIAARFGGRRARPLVFINACHTSRSDFALTGIGGWADRLVRESRVGAFVGAAWEVNDQLGFAFCEAFYTALLKEGRPFGESFRLARARIRDLDSSNSTWLSYVLYADPGAPASVAAATGDQMPAAAGG
ncbi:MAG: CHAT domain-containing protein [Chloroflexi bacterium]|nr:CHAT domain-containing protein [Chloroflexota bacterium]